jgi:hypothetical protein
MATTQEDAEGALADATLVRGRVGSAAALSLSLCSRHPATLPEPLHIIWQYAT